MYLIRYCKASNFFFSYMFSACLPTIAPTTEMVVVGST